MYEKKKEQVRAYFVIFALYDMYGRGWKGDIIYIYSYIQHTEFQIIR